MDYLDKEIEEIRKLMLKEAEKEANNNEELIMGNLQQQQ
jgi:hypothetical protein